MSNLVERKSLNHDFTYYIKDDEPIFVYVNGELYDRNSSNWVDDILVYQVESLIDQFEKGYANIRLGHENMEYVEYNQPKYKIVIERKINKVL